MKKVLLVVGFIVAIISNPIFAYSLKDMERDKREMEKNTSKFDSTKTIIKETNSNYIVINNTSSKIIMPYALTNALNKKFIEVANKECKKYGLSFVAINNAYKVISDHEGKFICRDIVTNLRFEVEELEETVDLLCNAGDDYEEQCRKIKVMLDNAKFELEEAKANNQPSISTEDQNTIVAASSGTGFFVSTNGHMVTNNHVIDSCDNVKAHYKGRELDVNVLFNDRTNDLAIIKANIKPEKVFAISNEDVSLLEDIIVAGYPLGKNISASIKTFKGSVTALAGFGDNYSNFQIDASLSSGNSGGPIINQKGNVVGVAVEKLVEVGVEGFNFGVKSSTLKTFANSNQFKFQDPLTEELSNKELGQLITEATIYLECWMSVAKIKQIIEEGERQKAFFSEYK